ncbi:MAG: HutD family protein [Eubacteriaceae bacterium]|jgi:environmental stress-induced protein Ves|nr:HutD family protein [Eubacteriaceae bacterium]
MNSNIKIIKESQIKHMKWSGGTQSEVYIYPENSTFEERNFIFNLCTATVDLEKSNFTFFPNYNRIIMTLDNPLTLKHNDGEEIHLAQYQPHTFYGEDKTVSYGKVNDYNFVMARDKCEGDLQVISLARGCTIFPKVGNFSCSKVMELIYVKTGAVEINDNGITDTAHQGELIVFDTPQDQRKFVISNHGTDTSLLIIAEAHIL